jgi:hypothetical protein
VDLQHKNTKVDSIYRKFLSSNKDFFERDEFIHITEMNNHADLLANRGVDALR